ncbi:MAG TPA: FAD-dependent oxidoreductase [Candidatus Baltobacteraceae bacterium]|nr:FAD-dependent oxidoreductase [Candidatus Baltobacteraceae bacterium]
MAKQTFAIIGAGVAAATAADTLRSSGFDGRLVMIGKESDPPYNRPTLSKERLRGEISDDQALFHPFEYYKSKDIELLLEREVQRVSVAENAVHFAGDGAPFRFDRALIAVGARPRRVNVPGTELEGVYYLRSLADCRKLSEALERRPRILVLGTGFIGCEVAASAKTVGCDVTVVGSKAPLAHALGPEAGEIYLGYHRGQGLDVRIGTSVARFEGQDRLERVHLTDGGTLDCDAAVIGIGVEPSIEIVRNEPVDTSDGILVDEFCKTTAPSIFAAGDVASSWSPRYDRRLRVEHFDNAQHQAVVAAKAMLGPTDPYNPIPTFWSDQYTYRLQYRGYSPAWDAFELRGKPSEGSFSAFYLNDGVVQAVCSVNRYKENYAARRLLGKRVAASLLKDDSADVKEIEV